MNSNECCHGSSTAPCCTDTSQSRDNLHKTPHAGQATKLEEAIAKCASVGSFSNVDIDQALDFALDFDELYISCAFIDCFNQSYSFLQGRRVQSTAPKRLRQAMLPLPQRWECSEAAALE
jgi:hypothetical protein